jgi:hypothetical protein
MKTKLAILIAGLGCIFAGSASAASPVIGDSDVEQVRMVCNDDGRCWDREEDAAIVAEGRSVFIARGYEDRD